MHCVAGVGSSVLGSLALIPSTIGSLACRIAKFVYSWFAPASSWNKPLAGDVQGKTTTSYALKSLSKDVFAEGICGFLEPKDLARCARVCQAWNGCFEDDRFWESQCHILLGLQTSPGGMTLRTSYKKIFRELYPNFFGKHFYERYIGNVGKVPSIPEHLSPLRLWDQPDPYSRVVEAVKNRLCFLWGQTPSKESTIGGNFIWIYLPPEVEIPIERLAAQELRTEEEDIVSTEKVPVTIKNLPKLFANPKEGHPAISIYGHIDHTVDCVMAQHGDTNILGGWVCMRKEVVDKMVRLENQPQRAVERNVEISPFIERVFLNCVWKVRFGSYLEGEGGARTFTTISRGYQYQGWPGNNEPVRYYSSGDYADGQAIFGGRSIRVTEEFDVGVGVAVALPRKVPAIRPLSLGAGIRKLVSYF